MHRDAANGLAIRLAVMRMTMEGHHRLMAVNHFSQPRTAQKRENLQAFSLNGFADRRIMSHNHDFWRAQHGERTFKFECLIKACLDKRFNLFFAESRQHAATKAAGKALGAGK